MTKRICEMCEKDVEIKSIVDDDLFCLTGICPDCFGKELRKNNITVIHEKKELITSNREVGSFAVFSTNKTQEQEDILALIKYIDFLHKKDPLAYNVYIIYINKFQEFNEIKKRYIP